MVLFLMTVLSGPAQAGALAVQVGGLEGARSVQVAVTGTDRPGVGACQDRGDGPDEAVDGVWSCEPLETPAGEQQVALVVDGTLLEAGSVVVPSGGLDLALLREGGRLTLDTGGDLLTPKAGRAPAGGSTLVRVQVRGDFAGAAPMLRLKGTGGSVQASCGDDGHFPDVVRNDGVLGCAGPAPGGMIRVELQVAGAGPAQLGEFADPGGQLLLALDAGAGTAEVAALPWPWPAAEAAEVDHQPGPDPEPPEPGPDPVPPEPGPEPTPGPTPAPAPNVVQPPVVTAVSPSSHGGAADRAGKGLIDALMVALALVVGVGVAWFLPQRGPRLPEGVSRVPSPSIFPAGGPGLDERAVLFRTDRPTDFAAALVSRLASSRSVLVVLPQRAVLPAIAGGSVYKTEGRDWEEVERQVRSLGRAIGQPPLVVVVGRDTLTAPGALAEDPAARLAERLPLGAWLGLVVAPDASAVGMLAPWDVHQDGDWIVTPGDEDRGTS